MKEEEDGGHNLLRAGIDPHLLQRESLSTLEKNCLAKVTLFVQLPPKAFFG